MSVPDICSIFQYCYVHDMEFEKDIVEIKYGTRYPPKGERFDKVNRLYPHVNLVAYGPCWHEEAKEKEVSFCPTCREAYLKEYAN